MNWIKQTVCLGLGLISMHNTMADHLVCRQGAGYVRCDAGTTEQIQGMGHTFIEGTQVKSDTTIQGMLEAHDFHFNTLTVQGVCRLNHGTVEGAAHIMGDLTAAHVHFKQPIVIASNHIELSGSTAPSITVRSSGASSVNQVILKNSAQIKGGITFEQSSGGVWLYDQAQCTGPVYNGRIIHKS